MISGNFGEDYHSFTWKIGFTKKITFETLTKHFQTISLKGFGIEELKEGIIASGPFCIICPKRSIIKYNI
jgi:DNA mismatch repair protein MutS